MVNEFGVICQIQEKNCYENGTPTELLTRLNKLVPINVKSSVPIVNHTQFIKFLSVVIAKIDIIGYSI